MADVVTIAARAARLAGQEILRRAPARREVSWKVQDGVSSIVTDADLAAESAIRRYLAEVRSNDLLLAEEGETVDPRSARLWVVDPLDGSTNFSRTNPFWCVSVAYAEHGEVQAAAVFDPFRREMFTARRGGGARLNGKPIQVTTTADLRESVIACGAPSPRRPDFGSARRFVALLVDNVYRVRVYGATALELCWVAAGRLEGVINWNSHWWDVAAASLIVTEAGGACSPAMHDWAEQPTSGSIGSNGRVHADLERLVRECAGESGPRE